MKIQKKVQKYSIIPLQIQKQKKPISKKKPIESRNRKLQQLPVQKSQKKIKKDKRSSKSKQKFRHGLKELQSLKARLPKEKKQKDLFIKCVNCGRQHKLFPGDEYLLRRQKYFVCKQLTQMDCVLDESAKKSVAKEVKNSKKLARKSKLIKKNLKKDKKVEIKNKDKKKKKPIYSWIQCEACDKWFQLYNDQKFLLSYKNFYCKDLLGVKCKEYEKKFPEKKFKSEEAELKYLLKTAQFDKMHVDKWIQCTKCQKWRLAASEKGQPILLKNLLEFNKLSKKKTVTCQDMGKNCRKKEDKLAEKYISLKK